MKNWLGRFLTSSLGRKYVMAVSGLALVLFLVAHLAGKSDFVRHHHHRHAAGGQRPHDDEHFAHELRIEC